MNLSSVMQELAARLATITTLQQVNDRPVDAITPPAAMVGLPDSIDFDQTYGRGMDRMTLPLLVLVAKVSDRAARDQLLAYVAATGAESIKAVLESGTYTTFDTLRVTRCSFEVDTIQSVDYLGANFTLDIAGKGAA